MLRGVGKIAKVSGPGGKIGKITGPQGVVWTSAPPRYVRTLTGGAKTLKRYEWTTLISHTVEATGVSKIAIQITWGADAAGYQQYRFLVDGVQKPLGVDVPLATGSLVVLMAQSSLSGGAPNQIVSSKLTLT